MTNLQNKMHQLEKSVNIYNGALIGLDLRTFSKKEIKELKEAKIDLCDNLAEEFFTPDEFEKLKVSQKDWYNNLIHIEIKDYRTQEDLIDEIEEDDLILEN